MTREGRRRQVAAFVAGLAVALSLLAFAPRPAGAVAPDLFIDGGEIAVAPDFGSAYVFAVNSITVTVHNVGTADVVDDFPVAAYRGDPDVDGDGVIDPGAVLLGSTTVNAGAIPVMPGQSRAAAIPWTAALAEVGTFRITVVVDYQDLAPFTGGLVGEDNTTALEIANNRASYDTGPFPAGREPPFRTATPPDYEVHPPWVNLLFENLTVWPDFGSTFAGFPLRLNATVANNGTGAVTRDFPVGFFKGDPDADGNGLIDAGAFLLGAAYVPAGASPIGPGQNRTVSIPWTPLLTDIGEFLLYATVDLQYLAPFTDADVDERDALAYEIGDNKALYNTSSYASGSVPPYVTGTPPAYEVHPPPVPLPARNTRTQRADQDILVTWEPPFAISIVDFFRVFRGTSPRGIDLANPIGETIGLSFLDPGAAAVPGEHYYVVRSVNGTANASSETSPTAGAFTVSLDAGWNAISIPLEPYGAMDLAALQADLGATAVDAMDGGGRWVRYPGGPNVAVGPGVGYVVEIPAPKLHTFLGFPGSMIGYDEGFGFSASLAGSLHASVAGVGDVVLEWARPGGPVDHYCVSRSDTRDGFHAGTAVGIGCTPGGDPDNLTFVDLGTAAAEGQRFYTVYPATAAGFLGSGTYSIGVWTAVFSGVRAIGPPLRAEGPVAVSALLAANPGTQGILWPSVGLWVPHSAAMPAGVYDALFLQAVGYQISARLLLRLWFVGS